MNLLSRGVLAAFCLVAATPAFAEAAPPPLPAAIPAEITPEMQAAFRAAVPYCRADVARACPGVMPGGGRIAACVLEKFDALSPACQEKLTGLVPQ